MTFRVRLEPAAADYLKRLDRPTRERIGRRIDQLAEDPSIHSKRLRGTDGLRSSRVGAYRIILEIRSDHLLVLILRIAPRGEVYRRL